jgi:hypothetical protein
VVPPDAFPVMDSFAPVNERAVFQNGKATPRDPGKSSGDSAPSAAAAANDRSLVLAREILVAGPRFGRCEGKAKVYDLDKPKAILVGISYQNETLIVVCERCIFVFALKSGMKIRHKTSSDVLGEDYVHGWLKVAS